MNCILDAWRRHERELGRFPLRRTGSEAEADDLLQEVFLRGAGRGADFCGMHNPRAWLFRIARNLLVDRLRLARDVVPLLLAVTASMPAQAAGPERIQALAATCASCHGTDRGHPGAGLAPLAGVAADQARATLLRFKRGEKPATVTHQIVRGYTDSEPEAMADFFSGK
jgi:DNA-directed RNA polymerase specialized sigma24 family protein